MPARHVVSVALLLAGCAADHGVESGTARPSENLSEGIVVSSASWRLDWITDGVEPGERGWSTTTDLGYRVGLEAGWVLAYSVTLSPCIESTASRSERLWSVIGLGTAYADHPDFDDPSRVETVLPQSLTSPQAWTTDTTFEAATYCGLHHLLARGEADSMAPDGSSAFGYSLRSTVRWAREDREDGLEITTNWANGRDWGWNEVSTEFPEDPTAAASWHADILLARDLGALFDGVELDEASDGEIAWSMLESLLDDATVTVTFRPAE